MNKRLVSILISTALVFTNISTAMAEPAVADSVVEIDYAEGVIEEKIDGSIEESVDDNYGEVIEEIIDNKPANADTRQEIIEEISDGDIEEIADIDEMTDEKDIAKNSESESSIIEEDAFEPILNYHALPREDFTQSVSILPKGSKRPDYLIQLPSKYDNRSKLQNLRNQYPYGTCWAHSAMALAEISMLSQGFAVPGSIDYSELQLAYFTYNSVVDPLGGTAGDSNTNIGSTFMDRGGNLMFAENVLAGWNGAANESDIPYSKAKEALTSGINADKASMAAAHLKNYYEINTNDRDKVKELIMKNGAVGTSFHYNMTYYDEEKKSFYNNVDRDTNHAVTIVGWNDDFSADDFRYTAPGDGAWLIRNSWTTRAGEESIYGYFWMSYYDTSISNTAFSFEFDPATKYDNNYQYDGGFDTANILGQNDEKIKIANVFEAQSDEILEAVSFYTGTTNVSYDIKIYQGMSGTDPESGILVSNGTKGATTFAGYYTVELNSNNVELYAGEIFSVVVTLKKSGYPVSVGYEYSSSADWYETTTSAKPGQSFINSTGAWSDFASHNGNIRLKAFTRNVQESPTTILPTAIRLNGSLPAEGINIGIDETYQARASVLPINTTQTQLVWESSDDRIAKVDENGLVTGVQEGSALISVKALAAPTLMASFKVTVIGGLIAVNLKDITTSATEDSNVIYKYEKFKVEFTTTPLSAAYDSGTVKWYSSNPDAITIDNSGNIEAVGIGQSELSVEVDGILSNKINVVVMAAPINCDLILLPDNTVTIKWKGNPEDIKYVINVMENGGEWVKVDSDVAPNPSLDNQYTYTKFTGYNIATTRLDIVVSPVVNVGGINYTSGGTGTTIMVGPFANLHTLTYDADGGTIGGNATYQGTVLYNGIYGYQPTPVRKGYIFDGWYKDRTYSYRLNSNTYVNLDKDFTVYAKWEPVKYKIAYDGNGATSGFMDTVITEAIYDKPATLEECTLIRDGYDFKGWNTKSDGSGKSYDDKAIVSNLTDINDSFVTLYARWSIATPSYTVSFNAVGGEVVGAGSIKVRENGYYGDMPTAERAGYDFAGWYTEEVGGTKIEKNTKCTLRSNHTLYAHYTPHTYTVKYDGNNASTGALSPTSATYGVEFTLPANPYTRIGYAFKGWSLTNSGSSDCYNPGDTLKNLIAEEAGEVTIYAIWTPNKYRIDFDGNGNDGGSTGSVSAVYDSKATLSANGFTRTGYKFSKWTVNPDGSGASYNDNALVENLTSADGAIVKLYAKWEPIKYSIKYNGNGEVLGTMGDTIVKYDEAFSLAKNSFNKKGYSFAGWSDTPGEASVVYADEAMITDNLTETEGDIINLYAQWTPVTYSIKYNGNAATSGVMSNTEAIFATPVTLSANCFERTGYTFAGWSKEAGKKAVVYNDGATITDDIASVQGEVVNLYAQWSPINYFIKYHENSDATGTMADTVATYDSDINLRKNSFAKTGYLFDGWSTVSGNQTVIYQDEEIIDTNLSSDADAIIDLYAQWSPLKYTIRYEGNAATSGDMGITEATYDTPITLSANGFSRVGYTFAGWSKTDEKQTPQYVDEEVLSENLTTEPDAIIKLYAQWTPIRYSVSYNGNGSMAGSMESTVCTYDEDINLSQNRFEKTGYKFMGWSMSEGVRPVVYADKATIKTNLSTQASDVIKLYAQWEPVKYYIRYNSNNATAGSMTNQNVTYDESIHLNSNLYNKIGYKFVGWSRTPNGSIDYTDGQVISYNLADREAEVVNLYAKWEPIKYRLSFDGNGATSGSMEDVILTYGEAYTLSANSFARTGYEFRGFSMIKEAKYENYKDGDTVINLSNIEGDTVVFYAIWKDPNEPDDPVDPDNPVDPVKPDEPTVVATDVTMGKVDKVTAKVTFDFDGGKVIDKPYIMNPNSTKAKLLKPEKEGYTFKYWQGNGKKVVAINEKLLAAGDLYLKAIYTENAYTVTYKLTKPVKGVKFNTKPKSLKYKYTDNVYFPDGITAVDKAGNTYVLKGWSTTPSGEAEYSSKDKEVSKLGGKTKKNKKVVLYSVWELE